MDDKQLMTQIAAGDQAALQTLLRRHGPLLQYILKPILTDPRAVSYTHLALLAALMLLSATACAAHEPVLPPSRWGEGESQGCLLYTSRCV